MAVTLRTAFPQDAAALLAIYAPYVRDTAISFEYQPPTEAEFRGRMEKTLEKYPYLVAEEEGRILGYAYLHPFQGRAAYGWCAETSIYLDWEARGRGIGRLLYERLEAIAAAQGIRNLVACITFGQPGNSYVTDASVRFHQKLGYEVFAKFDRCGYKFGCWFGVTWLVKRLGDWEAEPQAVIPFSELKKIEE